MKSITFLLLAAVGAKASCECGYVDENGNKWMDALVIPFNKMADYSSKNVDVYLNDYVHNKAFGTHDYHIDPKNVESDANGDLLLWTRPPVDGVIPSSQISTRRNDILYGTVRSVISFPSIAGSCAGLFSYYNDSQEIDIEYLGQKNYMLYVSSKTIPLPDFKANTWENVALNGTKIGGEFVEYRFDWLPDRVDFYMGGRKVSTLPASPSMPSKLMLMNWSSGDKDWSGMPKEDIVSKFRNLVAFFNSTNTFVKTNFDTNCAKHASSAAAVCKTETFSTTQIYGYNENVIRLSSTSSASRSLYFSSSSLLVTMFVVFVASLVLFV